MATEGNVPGLPPAVPPEGEAPGLYALPGTRDGEVPRQRRHLLVRARRYIQAVRESDREALEEGVLRLSRSRRWLAPLALAVGALAMLFDGVKLLVTNWRLTLVQVLPAMWIWAAMLDLKAHVLHGKSFHVLTGPVVIPVVLAVAAITAASFFLNAVFAFAIANEGPPAIRPAFAQARSHLAVGALAMLFDGVKLLFSNWRLTLVQVLPAMWIWAAMVDLKAHVLHGKSLHVLTGPVVIPIVLAVAAITAASFFLNAVFAFAIASEGPPAIRPAFAQARSHLAVVLGWGGAVGICLGLATVIFARWGLLWFGLSLSIVVGVMMVCYVAVPARLIGMKTTHSKRDKLTASAVGGAVGAVVCTPPYVLGRVGLIMLGSHTLFILGCVLLAIGLTLQAGATGAVKAVKMSAKLVSGNRQAAGDSSKPEEAARPEHA